MAANYWVKLLVRARSAHVVNCIANTNELPKTLAVVQDDEKAAASAESDVQRCTIDS
jgi:hypothetical protein